MADRIARMAVIGLGTWGQNHCTAYADYHRSRLALVCDLDEARARDSAQRFGCDYTTRVEDVAANPDIDAVAVATPDFAHLEPALAVLRAGKHLIIEKPLATDLDEARQIVEARRAAAVKGMTDFQNRWRPHYATIKRAIERGRLGDPVSGYAWLSDAVQVATAWLPWAARSGPHWFLMCHTMDLVRWFYGREPVEVYATAYKGVLAERGVDTYDCVQALVRFQDGASCVFDSSWIIPDSSPNVIASGLFLQGSRGHLQYEANGQELRLADADRFGYPGQSRRNPFGRLDNPFYEPMRHFVDCVLDGVEPAASLEDGYAVTAMLCATVQSIESGKPVPIDPVP
ncbi:MAG: Gfo/Idh/MocA family oxidoreductase [Chloroflexi bacterium]|nr:Gfo/Idh/MocA family oxidoreductase [Chloroflexota bacterium]